MTQDTNAVAGRAGGLGRFGAAWVAALLVFKLVLVSHEEIRSVRADDSVYALMSNAWYWGNPYTNFTYSRQPVYPVFVALGGLFGMPQRLWAELAWTGLCTVIAAGAVRCGLRRGAGLVLLGVLMFLPGSFMLLSRLGPDWLYGGVLAAMVVAAGAAIAANARGAMWRWSVTAAMLGAAAANLRQESVVTFALLAMGGGLAWWMVPRVEASRRERLARAAVVGVMPLIVAMGACAVLAQANKQRIGVAVTHDLAMPGFKGLYQELLAIQPEKPEPRRPVPAEVRMRAYGASPSFARLRPFLDGDGPERVKYPAAEKVTGDRSEYGGWTVWALRSAAWGLRPGPDGWRSAAELDGFYRQCAGELRAAMKDGRLPHRWAPVAFVPPEWGGLLARMPVSVGETLRLAADHRYVRRTSIELGAEAEASFDLAGMRRIVPDRISRDRAVDGAWWSSEGVVAAMTRVRTIIGRVYQAMFWVSVGVVGVGTAAGLVMVRRRGWMDVRGLAAVTVLLWAAAVSRVLLIALLDATGVPPEPRYVFPVQVMWWVLVVIAGQVGLGALRSRRGERA